MVSTPVVSSRAGEEIHGLTANSLVSISLEPPLIAVTLAHASRTYGLVGAALVCFMPMAHLQASTMQSDLLVAAFCCAAVCQMAQIYLACAITASQRAPRLPCSAFAGGFRCSAS